jgi:predicted adenine nucleotide alpha hydrolase (AANH) superfamily ATPase
MDSQPHSQDGVKESLPRLLLHCCCAPCATHSVARLSADREVTLFFSNSNLFPESEYVRRLAEARRLAREMRVPLVVDPYDHGAWRRCVAGLEEEPERGRRCEKCFEFSLRRTANHARAHGFDAFTTTLTISPHKEADVIFRVGRGLGPFLEVDLKKQDGFRQSIRMSRELGLYRQDYCGCEFSRRSASASVAREAPTAKERGCDAV